MSRFKRRYHRHRPAAAPYVDRLLCPRCGAMEVTGTRSWLVARLDCGACGARFSPCEYEAALEIALSGVKSPGGAA